MIDFEEIKNGRSVESIKFTIQRKEGAEPARYQRSQTSEQRVLEENEVQEVIAAKAKKQSPILPTAEEIAQNIAQDDLKNRLINFGVSDTVAQNFVQTYTCGYLERAISYVIQRDRMGKVGDFPAFLVDVVHKGYN